MAPDSDRASWRKPRCRSAACEHHGQQLVVIDGHMLDAAVLADLGTKILRSCIGVGQLFRLDAAIEQRLQKTHALNVLADKDYLLSISRHANLGHAACKATPQALSERGACTRRALLALAKMPSADGW